MPQFPNMSTRERGYKCWLAEILFQHIKDLTNRQKHMRHKDFMISQTSFYFFTNPNLSEHFRYSRVSDVPVPCLLFTIIATLWL